MSVRGSPKCSQMKSFWSHHGSQMIPFGLKMILEAAYRSVFVFYKCISNTTQQQRKKSNTHSQNSFHRRLQFKCDACKLHHHHDPLTLPYVQLYILWIQLRAERSCFKQLLKQRVVDTNYTYMPQAHTFSLLRPS